jgi:Na+/H+-dicarboxylate symporter
MWIGCVLILAFLLISSMEQLRMGSQMLMKGDIAEGLGTMTGVAIFIALGAALVIYPTLKLTKYASNIGRLVESQSFTDLCAALREQRRFWKFHGILSLICICVIGGVVFLKLKEKGMLH